MFVDLFLNMLFHHINFVHILSGLVRESKCISFFVSSQTKSKCAVYYNGKLDISGFKLIEII